MIDNGVARIPEDRHSEGLIGDMSVTENAIAENCRKPPLLSHGLIDWTAARRLAEDIISRYDVKCPSPETPVRLLSGGNMQKLILGRALDGEPLLIVASQPTRGLDVGAVSYVHERLLAERRRGAAILLISEDLDELLALSDWIAVIYRGQLSTPMRRSDVTIKDLGLMMAGAAHAA
jgi:simple sugar transport system ATP-binding protein